jgi:UDP-N-acetylmuramoyl-tripeptide--D-alanyl-D-alanine ligase
MPFALTLAEAAAAIGAPAPTEDLPLTGISTDTRTISQGALFVALKGEKFDGHDYAVQAIGAGAAAIVADHNLAAFVPVLVAKNTTTALGDLALAVRKKFTGPVVGITGSVGKTTTKELTATLLETMFSVAKSSANFNNEIGLPQTIFGASETSTAWILEMGMRGAGQIAELARIAQPTVGIITGIGFSHIELLGSRQGIANAKAELFEALPENGISIYPATDDFAQTLATKARGRVLTVGLDTQADVQATDIVRQENGWRFTIHSPWGTQKAFLPSAGRFNIQNALLGIAAGGALNIPLDSLAKALLRFEPPAMRLEEVKATCGATVIADCYNAAPDSMVGALQTLAEAPLHGKGKRIAVLGEMKELGRFAEEAHKMVGRVAAKLKLDMLVLVGEQTTNLSAAAIAEGFDRNNVFYFDQTAKAAEAIAFIAQDGDVILAKGSRAMELERVVKALQPEWSGGKHE